MANKDRAGQVLAAVRRVLAADVSEEDRRRADAFLQSFQKTTDAIPVSLSWLTQENGGAIASHEQLFLVNTIYRALCSRGSKDNVKYQHRKEDAPAIPPADLAVSCFHQLCRHIYLAFSHHNTPMNIANQFACCVTVCILGSTDAGILHTLDHLSAHERAAASSSSDASSMHYCIEMAVILVLQLVPEEIQNKRLLLRGDHRGLWDASVKAESTAVLTALERCWRALHGHDLPRSLHDKMELAIFQSFGTWVEHGALPPPRVAQSPLLQACLDHSLLLDLAPRIDVVFEVVRDVVHVCVDAAHEPLVHVLLAYAATHLGPRVLHAMASDDVLLQAASTIADVGQQAIACGVFHAPSSSDAPRVASFLDVLLAFTAHPAIDVASKTLDFWVALRDAVASVPVDAATYDPTIQRVVHQLLLHTEYTREDDVHSDEFTQYRKDIRTVLRALTQPSLAYQHQFISDLVRYLGDEFNHDVARLTKLEVYLHALSAMAKAIPDSEDTFVFQLLEHMAATATAIPALDFAARAYLRTATVFLSVVTTWVAAHAARSLPLVYAILSKCFECTEDDAVCPMRVAEDHIGAVALLKMSTSCAASMSTGGGLDWLRAMQAIYRANISGGPSTMTDKSLGLVLEAYAAVAAVPHDNYYEAATPAIVELCGIVFEYIEVVYPECHTSDAAQTHLVCALGHLGTLAAALPPLPSATGGGRHPTTHPMLHVLQLNWSTLQLLFGHASPLIQAKVSVVLSTLFRAVGSEAAPLALVAIPMFLEAFEATPLRCYLDGVASTLDCTSADTPDVNRLLTLTLAHVAQLAPQTPLHEDDQSTLAGVLDFITVGGARRPHLLADAHCFEFFFHFATETLGAGCMNPSLFRFFQATWGWCNAPTTNPLHASVTAYLVPRMVSILQHLVFAAIRLPPTAESASADIAETLMAASRAFDPTHMAQYMHVVLQDPSFPRPGLSLHVKREFVDLMVNTDKLTTPRKLRRMLKQLCK
ncbi:Aste57867_11306 [Aphanomyces stellatus]|uniref:Aste57867_11306 protein n=1 Tax=Aphanomyces stellatus TaxID=120398 RepID=A0A485KT90_9STRA|nr:hypothetical protein As57867_011264 [Aphanomyces stellatus]VFT88168.1 Aste57867_11306 [Aphanomyces stellatus]